MRIGEGRMQGRHKMDQIVDSRRQGERSESFDRSEMKD